MSMESVDESVLSDSVVISVALPTSHTKHHNYFVEIPRVTLKSTSDPTLFYRIPKGCALWEGGHALAVALGESEMLSRLVDSSESFDPAVAGVGLVSKPRIIELGSGLAPLPSYVASAMFPDASVIIATDYMDRIVKAAAASIQANGSTCSLPISVAKYAFGDDIDVLGVGKEKFDLILGADLLYRDG
jgi:hypothetical protein